jgi:hypothetical protein
MAVAPGYVESPLYVAMMLLEPEGRTILLSMAALPVSWTVPPGSAVPLSVKVTAPVGEFVAPVPETNAVRVTAVPADTVYKVEVSDNVDPGFV